MLAKLALAATGGGPLRLWLPAAFWGAHGRCDSGFLQTNNDVEGFRQGFATSVVRAGHPNTWRFLTALKRQQAITRLDMAGTLAGNEKKPTRGKRWDNGRILTRMAKYLSGETTALKRCEGLPTTTWERNAGFGANALICLGGRKEKTQSGRTRNEPHNTSQFNLTK